MTMATKQFSASSGMGPANASSKSLSTSSLGALGIGAVLTFLFAVGRREFIQSQSRDNARMLAPRLCSHEAQIFFTFCLERDLLQHCRIPDSKCGYASTKY